MAFSLNDLLNMTFSSALKAFQALIEDVRNGPVSKSLLDEDDGGDNEIAKAAYKDGSSVLRTLLLNLPDANERLNAILHVNQSGNNAITKAVAGNDAQAIRTLLEALPAAEIRATAILHTNAMGYNAVGKGAITGNIILIRSLLDALLFRETQLQAILHRGDGGFNAIGIAIIFNKVDLMKLFLDYFPDNASRLNAILQPLTSGNNLLAEAGVSGGVELIHSLLNVFPDETSRSAAILHENYFGENALDLAIRNQNKNSYQLLISQVPAMLVEAYYILRLQKKADRLENEAFQDLANDQESSMNARLLKAANEYFESTVKPSFIKEFESYRSNGKTPVEAIEEEIRGRILEAIEDVAKHAEINLLDRNNQEYVRAKQILALIQQDRLKLIAAEPAAMAAARTLFTSNTINAEIAWRGYDKEAIILGNFPNLLTHSLSEQAVYTTRESSAVHLNELTASQIVRERAAFYFLLAKAELMQEFINYLAEIRRGNNRNSIEMDDPSCFQGNITRLARIADKHFLSQVDNSRRQILEGIAKKYILKEFEKNLSGLSDEGQFSLYSSLVMLNEQNAADVFDKRLVADVALLPVRQEFINKLGNSLLKYMTEELAIKGISPLTADDKVYIEFAIVNAGGGGNAKGLYAIFEKNQRSINLATEVMFLDGPHHPFAKFSMEEALDFFVTLEPGERRARALKIVQKNELHHKLYNHLVKVLMQAESHPTAIKLQLSRSQLMTVVKALALRQDETTAMKIIKAVKEVAREDQSEIARQDPLFELLQVRLLEAQSSIALVLLQSYKTKLPALEADSIRRDSPKDQLLTHFQRQSQTALKISALTAITSSRATVSDKKAGDQPSSDGDQSQPPVHPSPKH